MNVNVISGSTDPLWEITNAARQCTDTQNCNHPKNREAFVRARIKSGEENLLEHAYVQLQIKGISRACLQQLVRHRYHVVYAVESQRYVKQDTCDFIVPPSLYGTPAYESYITACEIARQTYISMLDAGIKKEDARYILPESTTTNLIITYNFRGLRHLIRMRDDAKAQWEIRALAQEIRKKVAEKYGTDFFAEGL